MSTAFLRRRIVEIDAEIVEQKLVLARKLAVLEQDRADLQRQLQATSTFPVLTLPVEITADIFSLCLSSIEELREDKRVLMSAKLNTQAPTVFMGVCRAWRDIALATPVLWATLYFRVDIIHDVVAKEPGKIEAFIERWLQRAALRPLSVGFRTARWEANDFVDGPFTPSRLRDVIHRYADRIEYLELDFSQHEMRQLQLELAVFPILQRVALGDWYGPEPDGLNPVEVFSKAPRLYDLHLIHQGIFSYYSPPSLQLTKFDGEIDNLELFTLAPNLTEARCAVEYLMPVPTSFITHSRLHSLTLFTSFNAQKPIDILRHLTLPALQSLHISEMEDTMYYTLPQFLARSSPLLRSLSIRLDDTDFDWAECFSLIGATLENLEVEYPLSHVQSAIFTCHDYNNSEIRPPFPRLQTFRLKTQSGIEYGTLIRFLDARTRRSEFVTLRSFHLVCSRDTFLDDNIYAPSSADGQYRHDEVAGHLASLARSRGIDINIGADGGKTHVNFWYVLILG